MQSQNIYEILKEQRQQIQETIDEIESELRREAQINEHDILTRLQKEIYHANF